MGLPIYVCIYNRQAGITVTIENIIYSAAIVKKGIKQLMQQITLLAANFLLPLKDIQSSLYNNKTLSHMFFD